MSSTQHFYSKTSLMIFPASLFANIPTENILVFSVILFAVVVSLKKNTNKTQTLSLDHTQELKWFAILAVICIHISLSLVNDWQYLYPLWTFAGVWVDIFLFLSWYGLTKSMIKNPLSPLPFYRKRLMRVFVPFWAILFILLIGDWIFLGKNYDFRTIVESFFVYFPTADIWRDINSPFWYLSLLLFFYILFPIFWQKKSPWITGIVLSVIGYVFVICNPLHMETNWLHALHILAFPLWVLAASDTSWQNNLGQLFINFRKKYSTSILSIWLYSILGLLGYVLWKINTENVSFLAEWFSEQLKSLTLAGIIISFFIFKPFTSRFLAMLWLFSYEIYLIHWPLISRYDPFFAFLPTGVATLLWIPLLVFLWWGLSTFFKKLFTLKS